MTHSSAIKHEDRQTLISQLVTYPGKNSSYQQLIIPRLDEIGDSMGHHS